MAARLDVHVPQNHMAQLSRDRQVIRPCPRIGSIDTSTGIGRSSNRHRDIFMSVAVANRVCSALWFITYSDLRGPRPAAPEAPPIRLVVPSRVSVHTHYGAWSSPRREDLPSRTHGNLRFSSKDGLDKGDSLHTFSLRKSPYATA